MPHPLKIYQLTLDKPNLCLHFRSEIDFEHFDSFATEFCNAIDSRVIQKHWGADRHQWQLDFEGCLLNLNYEFYSDSCWLSIELDKDLDTLIYLKQLLDHLVLPAAPALEANNGE
ncbi:DUF3630 family protein [Parashewanella tropica]|uniref:DUF3630 family protein n=1 Tax=Parashewanella tropica TaxID=2547970 RepID=UPI001FE7D845|nr:DUF3630 family protein [Parashewanella tropica]